MHAAATAAPRAATGRPGSAKAATASAAKAAASVSRAGTKPASAPSSSSSALPVPPSSAPPSVAGSERAWGQRCSPACGCVVRFDASIDAPTGTITRASHVSRAVLAIPGPDGSLMPRMTSHPTRSRPMLTECKCDAANDIASRIVRYMPGKKFDSVRNATEYEGHRSSVAFREAVMKELGLDGRSEGGCYDLVEEAFLAMVRGYVPAPRRTGEGGGGGRVVRRRDGGGGGGGGREGMPPRRRRRTVAGLTDGYDNDEDDGRGLNPLRYAEAARRAGRVYPSYGGGGAAIASTSSSPAADGMPAFHMAPDDEERSAASLVSRYDDALEELCRDIEGASRKDDEDAQGMNDHDDEDGDLTSAAEDWVTYVDEQSRGRMEEDGQNNSNFK
uniref:Uncharacterized protein n=1 Tax=Trieres chinensis TaxID=1514140 RepID=A0A7S2ED91_TRICV